MASLERESYSPSGGFAFKRPEWGPKHPRNPRRSTAVGDDDTVSREVYLLTGRNIQEFEDRIDHPEPLEMIPGCECARCRKELQDVAADPDEVIPAIRDVKLSSLWREPQSLLEDLLSTHFFRRRAGLECKAKLAVPNFARLCDCVVTDTGLVFGEASVCLGLSGAL